MEEHDEQQHDSQSSVLITRTAKGETTFAVKVYRAPGKEGEAKEIAQEMYAELEARFYPPLTERLQQSINQRTAV